MGIFRQMATNPGIMAMQAAAPAPTPAPAPVAMVQASDPQRKKQNTATAGRGPSTRAPSLGLLDGIAPTLLGS